MTKIENIDGIEIKLNENDHNPPHVHVIGPDFEFCIRIDSLEILAGKPNRKAKKAIAWVKENQIFLMEKWNQNND